MPTRNSGWHLSYGDCDLRPKKRAKPKVQLYMQVA